MYNTEHSALGYHFGRHLENNMYILPYFEIYSAEKHKSFSGNKFVTISQTSQDEFFAIHFLVQIFLDGVPVVGYDGTCVLFLYTQV